MGRVTQRKEATAKPYDRKVVVMDWEEEGGEIEGSWRGEKSGRRDKTKSDTVDFISDSCTGHPHNHKSDIIQIIAAGDKSQGACKYDYCPPSFPSRHPSPSPPPSPPISSPNFCTTASAPLVCFYLRPQLWTSR